MGYPKNKKDVPMERPGKHVFGIRGVFAPAVFKPELLSLDGNSIPGHNNASLPCTR